ncbi:MAG: FKBP-type peptidyl-prolyl cis-trans isomerase [Bacteroidales bacterium]|jgi:FKBP-type peptidyl-prolyl cis-trans isomerase|nr:FKBP-type peptidyl-prolyl cis-trans isomerase [Bacteroidales bacterium]
MLLSGCQPGCRRYNVQQPEQTSAAAKTDDLLRIHQYLVDKDMQDAKSYAAQKNWHMQVTPSGLLYEIYWRGDGRKTIPGQIVELSYILSLADSSHTVCYTSERLGIKSFRIGQGGVEAGLEEGVLLMREGDKAHFILLPHLAYGLMGDDGCIPRRATIVYDVELLGIRNVPNTDE